MTTNGLRGKKASRTRPRDQRRQVRGIGGGTRISDQVHLLEATFAAPFTTADWSGPGTGFTIVETVAYVDTCGIPLPYNLPRDLNRALRSHYGKSIRLLAVSDRIGYRQLLILHQPRSADLADLWTLYGDRAKVSQLHIAIDLITARRTRSRISDAHRRSGFFPLKCPRFCSLF